jgi:hypothetical protein
MDRCCGLPRRILVGVKMTLRSTEHMEEIRHFFDSWYDAYKLGENILRHLERGNIIVTIPGADSFGENWEGEILIEFGNLPIATVVNDFIFPSGADEISIEDNGDLRLWWD